MYNRKNKLNNLIKNIKTIISLFFLALPIIAYAQSKVTSQPLYINSDSAQMNYHTGVNIYQGDVIATHAKSKLTGDTMTTYRNKQHKVYKVVIVGNPASLFAQNNDNKPPLYATAQIIKYYPLKHLAVFEKNAIAKQDKDVIKGPIITYNTQTQVLETSGNSQKRAHIQLDDQQTTTQAQGNH